VLRTAASALAALLVLAGCGDARSYTRQRSSRRSPRNHLTSQATSETFDVRRGNVVVTSDEGTSPALRRRIRAALAELPA
jgi:hypothetical protein